MIFLEVPPNLDPNVVRPGLGALLLTIGMLAVVLLLTWSMVRHMRRIKAPYADEVKGTQHGVQEWAEEMRANSPDHAESDDVTETQSEAADEVKQPTTPAG